MGEKSKACYSASVFEGTQMACSSISPFLRDTLLVPIWVPPIGVSFLLKAGEMVSYRKGKEARKGRNNNNRYPPWL